MAQLSFQVTGVSDTVQLLKGLPINLRKELNRTSGDFMKDVQKSAKLRAPRDTRETANSIRVFKKGNVYTLEVQSPGAIFQEQGFKPHWIHSDQIIGSNKLQRKGFYFVRKSTPFVKPALESQLSKLAQRLSKATVKAIKKSKKGGLK